MFYPTWCSVSSSTVSLNVSLDSIFWKVKCCWHQLCEDSLSNLRSKPIFLQWPKQANKNQQQPNNKFKMQVVTTHVCIHNHALFGLQITPTDHTRCIPLRPLKRGKKKGHQLKWVIPFYNTKVNLRSQDLKVQLIYISLQGGFYGRSFGIYNKVWAVPKQKLKYCNPPKGPYLTKGYFSLFLSVFYKAPSWPALPAVGRNGTTWRDAPCIRGHFK